MGRHLYCIVPSGYAPEVGLTGLEEAPVTSVDIGGISVWCSPSARPVRPTIEAIQIHDRVIRAAVSEPVTPLPIRFGQWFADREALIRRIESRGEGYAQALSSVTGRMEFAVRIVSGPPDEASVTAPAIPSRDDPGAGRAYLQALARHREARDRAVDRGQEVLEELEAAVGALAVDTRSQPAPGKDALATAAHLVARGNFDAYRTAVRRHDEGHPELEVVLFGPWPPYSFGPGPGGDDE